MRYKMPRWVPENAVAVEGEGVVVYCYENRNGRPSAVCYGGKRSKPDWNYCYTSEAKRDERVQDTLAAYAERAARKAAEKEARKGLANPLKVGDLLSASWGYDQTNVDYYQVVKTTKRMVHLRKVAGARVPDSEGMDCCRVTPCKDRFLDEKVLKKLVQVRPEKDGTVSCSVKVRDWGVWASPCTPDSTTYCSWYA
jgi:hypothetical protein